MKDQHEAEHFAPVVADGGGGVLDAKLFAIARNEDAVIGRIANVAFAAREEGIGARFPISFVDDVKNVTQGAPLRVRG